VVTYTGCNA
jgi:hypothetical protein